MVENPQIKKIKILRTNYECEFCIGIMGYLGKENRIDQNIIASAPEHIGLCYRANRNVVKRDIFAS